MYKKKPNRSFSIRNWLLLGALIGVLFLVYDRATRQEEPASGLPVMTQATSVALAPSDDTIDITSTSIPYVDTTPLATPQFADFQPDIPVETTLFIPSAGIHSSIVRVYLNETSWDVSGLGTNIGHLQGTPWLPENGNVVLSGHVELADGRAGAFSNLHELSDGEVIILTQDGEEYQYMISRVYTTNPTDLSPIHSSTEDKLTLITCGSYDFFSDSYLERVIVEARRIG